MSIIDANAAIISEQSQSWASRVWLMGKDAEELLWHSAYLELRNVSCDFHEGVLTLRGRVPSYYLKQLAQSLLRELDGVLELNNQLEVLAPRDVRQSNFRPIKYDHPPRRYV